ncbi:MAG: hypothetical protein H0W18_15495 [Acidobacteria bacterium]|nr:hypothetical protein [Acidobacteriota bacterium]
MKCARGFARFWGSEFFTLMSPARAPRRTIHAAIYRQALKFAPADQLRPYFFHE